MIITDIYKRFGIVIYYKKVCLAYEIEMNKVHGDFMESYMDLSHF